VPTNPVAPTTASFIFNVGLIDFGLQKYGLSVHFQDCDGKISIDFGKGQLGKPLDFIYLGDTFHIFLNEKLLFVCFAGDFSRLPNPFDRD
jgi:hypothetical protein